MGKLFNSGALAILFFWQGATNAHSLSSVIEGATQPGSKRANQNGVSYFLPAPYHNQHLAISKFFSLWSRKKITCAAYSISNGYPESEVDIVEIRSVLSLGWRCGNNWLRCTNCPPRPNAMAAAVWAPCGSTSSDWG